jgi:alkanesulfonate monooxygenase SsuD/methylene tetrahydromethanopterin reductase-like flavin-dependent oxidoreductase (luciferase family)
MLAKQVTTLDIISGGRAILGIGAAWHDVEHEAMGFDFPPVKERMDRLEEAVQICRAMFREETPTFDGQYYRVQAVHNVPRPIQPGGPPIMIGGGGEKKTLRFVAKYAQSCNLFPGPELTHKLDVLREHCEREGRDYNEIEKTAYHVFDVGPNGEKVPETIAALKELADRGINTAIGGVRDVHTITPLEIIGRDIIPAVAGF